MDRQERHELEQNDLAEAIGNIGQWWSRWGNTVLIVVLILAVSFTAYRLYSVRARDAREAAWGDLALASSPAALREVAESHKDSAVRALAYLRAGDLRLAEALSPPDEASQAQGDTPDAPPPRITKEEALEDASRMYALASEAARHPTVKANALLGMASVAESRSLFDEAGTHYRDVLKIAGDGLTLIAAQAQARLDALEELRKPIRFAPAPDARSVATPPASEASASENLAADQAPAGPSQPGEDAAAPVSSHEPASP